MLLEVGHRHLAGGDERDVARKEPRSYQNSADELDDPGSQQQAGLFLSPKHAK